MKKRVGQHSLAMWLMRPASLWVKDTQLLVGRYLQGGHFSVAILVTYYISNQKQEFTLLNDIIDFIHRVDNTDTGGI